MNIKMMSGLITFFVSGLVAQSEVIMFDYAQSCKATKALIEPADPQALDRAIVAWLLPVPIKDSPQLTFQNKTEHTWQVTKHIEDFKKAVKKDTAVPFLITPWKRKTSALPYRMQWNVGAITRACDIYIYAEDGSVGVMVYDQKESRVVLNIWLKLRNGNDDLGDYGRLIITIDSQTGNPTYKWARCEDLTENYLKKGKGYGKGYIYLD